MKTRLMMIASTLMASLICLPASAQPGPGMGGMGGGMSGMGPGGGSGMMQGGGPRAGAPRDCSLAPNPAACTAHREARNQAREACKNTAGPQRKQCMQEQRQNFDWPAPPSASACNRKCRRPIAARPRTRPAASCTRKPVQPARTRSARNTKPACASSSTRNKNENAGQPAYQFWTKFPVHRGFGTINRIVAQQKGTSWVPFCWGVLKKRWLVWCVPFADIGQFRKRSFRNVVNHRTEASAACRRSGGLMEC